MHKEKLEGALLALNIAIQTEKDGHEFYLGAARKTNDPQGKALFASLAADEIEHLRLLEGQREALTKEQRWLPHSELGQEAQVTKAKGAPIFSRGAMAQDINAYTSDLSALRVDFVRTEADWSQWPLLSFLSSVGFRPAQRLCLELPLGG